MKKLVCLILVLALAPGLMPVVASDATALAASTSSGSSGNIPPELSIQGGEAFYEYLTRFTRNLVAGAGSQEAQLMVIYDWMIRNFTYKDERDGPVIDGSRRPPRSEIPDLAYWYTFDGDNFYINSSLYFAWDLLTSGQGVCDCFSALFAYMAKIIGYDARVAGGQYINTSGRRSGHAWTVIAIDGAWYFFDPQIEASNLKRNRTNSRYNPRHWWKQLATSQQTRSRYYTEYDFSGAPPPPPPPFNDVSRTSPALRAISWANANGIITGQSGLFLPNDNMTREQFALVLWRYSGRPPAGAGSRFVDVPASDVAFNAIAWASERGIVTGRGDRFLPKDNMTRAEMVLMMYRFSRLYGKNLSFDPAALNAFADRGQIVPAAREAMLWGVTHGLITGRGSNMLPNDPVTREQVVLILYRYVHGIGA